MKDARIYLQDMLERMGRIETYTQGGQQTFMGSNLIQDAVIRNIELIGEAAKKFPMTCVSNFLKCLGDKLRGCVIFSFMIIVKSGKQLNKTSQS